MNKKVKKLLSIGALALSLGAILTACSGKKQGASNNKSSDAKHSIALITDGNGVNDNSFNQSAFKVTAKSIT